MSRLSSLRVASLLILTLLVAILLLNLLPSSTAAPAVVRKTWEYKHLLRPDVEKLAAIGGAEPLQDGLNELGKEGWELAAVEPSFQPTSRVGQPRNANSPSLYIFKRLK